MGIDSALSLSARQGLMRDLLLSNDSFIKDIPKVELHVHIEGTLTLPLRWKMAQRNRTTLRIYRGGPAIHSLEELKSAMDLIMPDQARMNNAEERDSFFDSYMEGFESIQTSEDFYDLAMNYFERVASMNVRYCEPFFDPQGHTSRGITWDVMMSGFGKAQKDAESRFGIKSQWIMCLLRDLSPESALTHYKAAIPYRHMIVGIGLDSFEPGRPPSLFAEIFDLARKDGFKLTAHCDVDQENTEGHIEQVLSTVGGSGADRIDHGLNAAEDLELLDIIIDRKLGMTLCPWSYMRHTAYQHLGSRIRTLYNAGVLITINSDDPAYMEDAWILQNFLLIKRICSLNNNDILQLCKNAIDICWATEDTKSALSQELEAFALKHLT